MSSEKLLYANFNQDNSCLAIGTDVGFKIFSCDPFRKCYERKTGGQRVVEMLYSTSLLGLVGYGAGSSGTNGSGVTAPAQAQRRVQLYNSSESKVICELNFVSAVLAVLLSKKRLVVVLESKIHVFDVSTMKILKTFDTEPNPKGLCTICSSDEQSYIAYPTSADLGDVMVVDIMNTRQVSVIKAHKGAVSALAFNSTGTLLATASEKGTVIRVFNVPGGEMVAAMRRGSSSAQIYSLHFSLTSSMLAVSSNKNTLHIFRVPNAKNPETLNNSQDASKKSSKTNVGSISDTLSNMVNTIRDFAHIRVKNSNVRNICAISPDESRLMLCTMDGYFFTYLIDTANGGECRLEHEFSLLSTGNEM